MNALAAVANPLPQPVIEDPGIVRRFLAWAPRACPEERARAISALARAYLYSNLAPSVRAEAAVALTATLDDTSAVVRRALAEALASAVAAPRHILLALAQDQSDVAAVVLALSPVFQDAELVDCAAVGDPMAQVAIARRPRVSAAVAAALAEVGERAAVLALVQNAGADLGANGMRRVLDRFIEDGAIREALMLRGELPPAMRARIAAATADALARCAASHAWLNPGRADRIGREAREHAFVAISASCSDEELIDLVAWLRESGALTVALLMRALMSGDSSLLRRALVDMSGLPERRVLGFLSDWRGHGFGSLYAKAGLPRPFLPAFRAALRVLAAEGATREGVLSRALTSQMIRACEELADPALAPIQAMLWRFASEAARQDAREFARETLVVETIVLDAPLAFEAPDAPPVLVLDGDGANENFAPRVELESLNEIAVAA